MEYHPKSATPGVRGHHDDEACPSWRVPSVPISTRELIGPERALQFDKGSQWGSGHLAHYFHIICVLLLEAPPPVCPPLISWCQLWDGGRVQKGTLGAPAQADPLPRQVPPWLTGPLSFPLSPVLHQQGGDSLGFSLYSF